jgi:Domain of unknown function (DUF1996)
MQNFKQFIFLSLLCLSFNCYSYTVSYSTSSNRANPILLESASFSGETTYIFVPTEIGITKVVFYLDNLATQTENTAPWDFKGGSISVANPFNTSSLSDGTHSITAVLTLSDASTQAVSSTFTKFTITATPTPSPTPVPTATPTPSPTPSPTPIPGMYISNLDPSTAPADKLGDPLESVVTTTTIPLDTGAAAKLRLVCGTTKFGAFDPIVFPGQATAGHHHTFFGNDSITGFSTAESLATTGGGRCTGGIANRSAYWVPTMYDTRDGKIIPPKTAPLIYYKDVKSTASYVQMIPDGLRIIAGNSSNSSITPVPGSVQDMGKVTFRCDAPSNASSGNSIPPDCSDSTRLRLNLTFPECWDGIHVDSANHKSHMAYATTGDGNLQANKCPTTHPVRIPTIEYIIDYPIVNGSDTQYWRFSSDMYDASLPGGLSVHGDVFEAWKNKWLQMVVTNCINGKVDCLTQLLGKDPDDGLYKKLN